MSETILDTQNEVKLVQAASDNPSGKIVVLPTGDFSGGVVELGYKDSTDAFSLYPEATSSADDGYALVTGIQDVFARATGATPDIKLNTTSVF